MQFAADELSTRELYQWLVRLITPRPIAWVSTMSVDGIANLAPYSFFNGVGANPPTVVFCPANRRDGTPKDTLANVTRTGQFVVNLVTEPFADRMNQTSAELDPECDEFALAEVDKAKSEKVQAPRVAGAAAAMECELHSAISLGVGPGGANLVIGRIVWIHIGDEFVGADGMPDPNKLHTIGRMGGNDYVRTSDHFQIERPK